MKHEEIKARLKAQVNPIIHVNLVKSTLLNSGNIETGRKYWINTAYLSRVIPEYDLLSPDDFKSRLGWVGRNFDSEYDLKLAFKRLNYALNTKFRININLI